jgi:Cdc6-like AAA superfamily ATPase
MRDGGAHAIKRQTFVETWSHSMPPATEKPEEFWKSVDLEVGKVFRPAAPTDREALFAGRIEQLRQVAEAINQQGQHAIIYGERGVGKTSLANVIATKFRVSGGGTLMAPIVNCDTADDYSSLWHKVFCEILISKRSRAPGFASEEFTISSKVDDGLPAHLTSEDVRRNLATLSQKNLVVIILDELDRLAPECKGVLSDTIKALSDHSVGATLVLVGVADTVDQLIAEHRSVERALVQVRMPRMSRAELDEIVSKGLSQLKIDIDDDAKARISLLSQGLPHYTHLLGLYSAREAIEHKELRITLAHVETAIKKALGKAQQSALSEYRLATMSNRKESLYAQVLLACALARTDEVGYFAAADVRDPLRKLTGKAYDIPSFARHLNDFCEPSRGAVLQKTGASRRFRFRFSNPLMQPFVTMQGFAAGVLTKSMMEWALRKA